MNKKILITLPVLILLVLISHPVLGFGIWVLNTSLVSGLGDIGVRSNPTVLNMSTTYHLIAGNSNGDTYGFTWNGTGWQTNASMGLGDLGDIIRPAIFNYGASSHLVTGQYDGTFVGHTWNGTGWQTNSSVVGGLSDAGEYSAPVTFEMGSTTYLITGAWSGGFAGYYWNGTAWQSSSLIVNGLGDVGDKSSPAVFNISSTYYLIAGTGLPGTDTGGATYFYGYTWNGTAWQSYPWIITGLVGKDTSSVPTVFAKASTLHMIVGGFDGQFDGYDWVPLNASFNVTLTSPLNNSLSPITTYFTSTSISNNVSITNVSASTLYIRNQSQYNMFTNTTGLFAYYTFDQNANDAMGLYNGTVSGATYTSSGKIGGAYSFDGDQDLIELPSTTKFNQASFSVSLWAYAIALDGIHNYLWYTDDDEPAVLIYSNGNIYFYIDGNEGRYKYFDTTIPSQFVGKWVHFVFTGDYGNMLRAYINGEEITGTQVGAVTNNRADSRIWRIGGDSVAGRSWNGKIDDVRIYNRTLSATEITNLYNIEKIDKQPTGLVGWWKLDNNTLDSSGFGNTGTALGATYTSSGKIGGAYSFDGTDDYVNLTNIGVFTTGQQTVSVWFTANRRNTGQYIFSMPQGATGNRVYMYESAGDIYTRIGSSSGSVVKASANWSLNTWYNLVLVRDYTNNRKYTYWNGILVNDEAVTFSSTDNTFVYLGSYNDALQFLNGSIDNVKIFNRALNQSEISAMYVAENRGYTGSNNWLQNFTAPGTRWWNVWSEDTTQTYGNWSSLYYLTDVDLTPPTITVQHPSGQNYSATSVPANVSINFTATDNNAISQCWFTTSFNSTITLLPSCNNASLSIAAFGNYSLTLFVNDTYNNIVNSTTYFSLNKLEYSPTAVETSQQMINITLYGLPLSPSSPNLRYDNTDYTATITSLGGGSYNLNKVVTAPSGPASINFYFSWTSGGTNYKTSTYVQTIEEILLLPCNATFNTTVLNITLHNADGLGRPAINGTLSASFDYTVGGIGTKHYANGSLGNNVSYYEFCLTPDYNVTLYAALQSTSPGFDTKNYELSSTPLIANGSSVVHIPLYLTNYSLTTPTTIKLFDGSLMEMPGISVIVQRYYSDINAYEQIESGITSDLGTEVFYMRWYDTNYKFIFMNGGSVILSTAGMKIYESPTTFTIGRTVDFDDSHFDNVTYDLYFDNATKNFVVTYVDTANKITSGCLKVVMMNATASKILYNQCVNSTSATLFYNIGENATGTYTATFYAKGSDKNYGSIIINLIKEAWYNARQSIREALGETTATLGALIVTGSTAFAFLFSPVIAVLAGLLGIYVSTIFGFYNITLVGFVGITVVGGIIIWSLKK